MLDLDETYKSTERFAYNSIVAAVGKRKVMIKKKNREITFVTDVLYMPSMKNNLLSVGQLLEKGFRIDMKENRLKVFDSRERLLPLSQLSKNKTFEVNLNAFDVQCFSIVCMDDERWLWHFRCGHLNFKSLHQLEVKGMVHGLPVLKQPDEICERCLVRKQLRNSFKPQEPPRANQSLEVVHSDVCGPIEAPSLGGRDKHFITFVDEFTLKIWLYLTKEKNEVFTIFFKFCVLVERQSENKLEILRIDGVESITQKNLVNFVKRREL